MAWGVPRIGPPPFFGGDEGDGLGSYPGAPMSAAPASPMAAAVAKKPGGGINWLGVLADALSGASGGQPLYAQRTLQQRQMLAQQALEEARQNREHDRSVADARANFVYEQQYRQAHPTPEAPTELERYMVAAHIDPQSPQGQAMLRDAAQNRSNPIQGVPFTDEQGNQGIRFVRPSQLGTAPPPIPADTPGWTPVQGGAGPQTPRTFPHGRR